MDSYTKHEAMDRAFLAVDYVENTLVHHEYYTSGENEEFNKLVDEAVECLSEAYQVINRTDMEAVKKSFLDCMSELVGMLPKVEDEDEGEERAMEIKVGQIWKCKRFGIERLVTYISDDYISIGTTTLRKWLFLRDYEFVRDESETSEPAKREPDMVNKPPHYKDASGIECKEITCHRKMPFSLGNAIKYLYRAGSKGDLLEDLRKAEWYLRVAYFNNEKVPKAVEVRLLEVVAHRKTAAGRALNLIRLHEIAAAYQAVKIEVEKLESGNE